MRRRNFLSRAVQLTAATSLGLGTSTWFARSHAAAVNDHRLIVVFLRGAVDGLSLLVPHQDDAYYEARPTIAIPEPGQPGGALDLDGQFGLHPELAMLLPLWDQKQLAFVQSSGSRDETRSHFDAQDYMESGTPGIKRTADGWMNRLLTTLSQGDNPIQAVNVGNVTPRILAGQNAVATIPAGRTANKKLVVEQENLAQAFDRLYKNNDALGQVYQDARAAREALQLAAQAEMMKANNGAPLPQGFPQDAQRLARIMTRDARVQLAFMDLGGWDTHQKQGASEGQLARHLARLGQGLIVLKKGLGSNFQRTTIVVMSEFGRTVRENGNGGTDHGHGNAMMLLGGRFPKGKIYGNWQGLATEQLHQERDLPVTTDFRDVLVRVLETQLNLNDAQLEQVFPNYQPICRLW